MRLLMAVPLLLGITLGQAQAASQEHYAQAFSLSGISLLCERALPLIQLAQPQHLELEQLFAAQPMCAELAQMLGDEFDDAQLERIVLALSSPLALQFTQAESAVGGSGGEALEVYSQQLQAKPPRAIRVELVQRLDKAARTTDMATLLRYEAVKTQALLALKTRGQTLTEAELAAQTAAQLPVLRESSNAAVASFMLFAYRQQPSARIAEYAALYEQPELSRLLQRSIDLMPQLFAERRAKLQ